jgi:hypothetical protein
MKLRANKYDSLKESKRRAQRLANWNHCLVKLTIRAKHYWFKPTQFAREVRG